MLVVVGFRLSGDVVLCMWLGNLGWLALSVSAEGNSGSECLGLSIISIHLCRWADNYKRRPVDRGTDRRRHFLRHALSRALHCSFCMLFNSQFMGAFIRVQERLRLCVKASIY